MGLRPVSDIGLVDATEVPGSSRGEDPDPAAASRPRPTHRPRPKRASTARSAPRGPSTERPAARATRAGVPLADEPTTFVQVLVPGEVQERLADASHALALEHRKLRHHKTILGALIFSHVDPQDAASLHELGVTLDGFLAGDVAEAPTEVKIAAHLPYSLKWNLDGALLRLRRTRRAATAKAMLSALVWRYVDPERLGELIPLLEAYQEAVKPRPLALGVLNAEARPARRRAARRPSA